MDPHHAKLTSLSVVAHQLPVIAVPLKDEAKDGRVSSLTARGQLLSDPNAVKAALLTCVREGQP